MQSSAILDRVVFYDLDEMNIASPKEKKRYCSFTAVRYASSVNVRPANALMSIINVDFGR